MTFANFNLVGTIPVSNDKLKIYNKGSIKNISESRTNLEPMLSGPGDLRIFIFSIIVSSSFLVMFPRIYLIEYVYLYIPYVLYLFALLLNECSLPRYKNSHSNNNKYLLVFAIHCLGK